jgi:hypothetical protein
MDNTFQPGAKIASGKPSAGYKVPFNRTNLWRAYCVFQCIKAEIEEVTGWPRSKIDYGLRKWDLHGWSDAMIDTRAALRARIAKAHGLSLATRADIGRADDALHAELTRLRQAMRDGTLLWATESEDGPAGDTRDAVARALGAGVGAAEVAE